MRPPRERLPLAVRDFEAQWPGELAARDIARSLAHRGESLWVTLRGPEGGGSLIAQAGAPSTRGELRRLSEAIVHRARVADPAAVCARLEAEWLAFLPPVATDTTCFGALTDQMTVSGTIGGVRVEREYSSCYSLTTGRWEELRGGRSR